MDIQNIHIQEACGKPDVKDTYLEDNTMFLNCENCSQSCLLSGVDIVAQQLREAQGYNEANIQSSLDQCVTLLKGKEAEMSADPPTKKLKTEHKLEIEESVANNIEDFHVCTQSDKESESNINEQESQQSVTGFPLNITADLFHEDNSNDDQNTLSKKTITSEVFHNKIDCSSTVGKRQINEAEEEAAYKGLTKSKMSIVDNQEETLFPKSLEKFHGQEMQGVKPVSVGQEVLISVTKRPVNDNSGTEYPQKEIIMLEDQNQKPQKKETTTLNEAPYGKNNCSCTAKEINKSEIEDGSERNETACDESGSGSSVKEIAVLVTEDKNQNVENRGITKPVCEEFISNDTFTTNQPSPEEEGNNETPSDIILTPNEVHDEETHCMLPAETSSDAIVAHNEAHSAENHGLLLVEKGNEEVADSAKNKSEKSLHMIVFEQEISWTALLQDEVFKLVDISCISAKYSMIKTLFQGTTQKHFNITKIVEVQNPFLYSYYLLKKAEMMSRYGHIKEEYLFHGSKIENISSICEKNLDWRKHGSITGNIFGKGVSLTPISCYASHYSDKNMVEKIIFVFRVIIADETEGNPDMVLPPYKDELRKLRYDTTVKPNRQVIVKYSDNEFYPAYVVYYTGKYKPRKSRKWIRL
ncbi:protein mono-ADP-ribosyltransferase PARP14-like [Schistocerca americana]|uniref:protein mono-ADP-ribosyltransferase PARP14-like n=1 Tax=Schistocerca americana TaxID=7009 RepID=UPI001F50230F|nr:protein mono-ADP-ribosyltransferase PARP14-like [Schistocerca americana]XP_046997386.1 protein mono-ADP-ribosyltransferase PARP14-like [Schistocerca americana]XP_046997387.1 protein mono-ADP-ribosyltransferase PARP14-like [Schistocerca americana]